MVKGPDWAPHPRLAESWDVSEDGAPLADPAAGGRAVSLRGRCDAGPCLGHSSIFATRSPDASSGTGIRSTAWRPRTRGRSSSSSTTPTHACRRCSGGRTRRSTTRRYGRRSRSGSASTSPTARGRSGSPRGRRIALSPSASTATAGRRRRSTASSGTRSSARLDRLRALERGEVDVVHGPPMADVDGLREDGRFVVVEHPQPSSVYLGLDWRRAELGFDDLRVREAISLAVDREAIVREVFAGRGAATWGPVPPGDEYYDPRVDEARSFDPRRAAELLRPRAATSRSTASASCRTTGSSARWASSSREQLAEVGVHLELRFAKPFAPFYDACAAGPPAFVNKWLWQDALDAVIGFASTGCKGFPNWQHASVPALDDAFDAWLRAGTTDELSGCRKRCPACGRRGASVRAARDAERRLGAYEAPEGLRALSGRPVPALRSGPPRLMLAARLHAGESRLRLEDVPVPEPAGDEVLVRVAAAGRLPLRPPRARRRLRRARVASGDDGPRDRRPGRGARRRGRRGSLWGTLSPSWWGGAAARAPGARPATSSSARAEGRPARLRTGASPSTCSFRTRGSSSRSARSTRSRRPRSDARESRPTPP